ncbi:MAG: hypothetical protein ACRDBM_16950 [Sporomusa sp.]
MKIGAKKVAIYLLVGVMHTGVFASVAQAAAGHSSPPRYEQRHDQHKKEQEREKQRHDQHKKKLEREKQRRLQAENARHEKEMKRRPFESKKKWRERQKKEIQRHEQAVREIIRMGHR